jgi:hypothetical protein
VIDLLCEKVEIPDFLLKEEKNIWDNEMSEKFSKLMVEELEPLTKEQMPF